MTFKTSLNGSTSIQKYLSIEKFLDLVVNNRLYFSPASNFSDKFEGKPSVVQTALENGTFEQLEYIANVMFPLISRNMQTTEDIKDLEIKRTEYKNKPALKVSTPFGEISCNENRAYENILETVNKNIFINCWHEDTFADESMAMWKIYGGAGASIMLTSTIEKASLAINIDDAYESLIERVEYIDENAVDFSNLPIQRLLKKRKAYEYEKEIRFLTLNPNHIPFSTIHSTQGGQYLTVKPQLLIESITISPFSEPWFVEVVQQLVADYLTNELVLKTSRYSI